MKKMLVLFMALSVISTGAIACGAQETLSDILYDTANKINKIEQKS